MSEFTITPFRINGIHKLVGMSINLYGREYTITNTKTHESDDTRLLGYVVVINSDTKAFYLKIDFSDGKVELWQIGTLVGGISKNLHKRDFASIPKFLHLTRYLMIEYSKKHPI